MFSTQLSSLETFFCSQYTAGFAMMMASASTGTFTGWATAILPIFQSPDWSIRMDQSQIAWVLSIHFLGNILGAIPAGIFIDKFGRKLTLLIAGLMLPLTSWILVYVSTGDTVYHKESDTVSSPSILYHQKSDTLSSPVSLQLKVSTTPGSFWYLLLVARLICGVWNGVVTTISPIYLAEIAEPNCRGRLNTLIGLFFRLGNLLAILASLVFSYKILPVILSISIVIFLLVFPFLPETPYYLVKKGEYTNVEKSLKWLRSTKLKQPEIEMELKRKIIGEEREKWSSKQRTKLNTELKRKLRMEIETDQEIEIDTKLKSELVEKPKEDFFTVLKTEQGKELKKKQETDKNAESKIILQTRLKTEENTDVETEVEIEPKKELRTELDTKSENELQTHHKIEMKSELVKTPNKVPQTEFSGTQLLETVQQKPDQKAQVKKELLQNELKSIQEAVTKQMQLQRTTFAQKFKSTTTIKSLLIVETLSILLRMAGIAPIINYVADSLPGSDHFNPNFFVLFIEVTRLMSSLLSSMFIDRLQRRALLIGASMVCGCSMTLMAGFYWFDDFNDQKFMVEKNYFENVTNSESGSSDYFEKILNFEPESSSYLENMTNFMSGSYLENTTNFQSGRINNYLNNVTIPESGRGTSIVQNSSFNAARIDFNILNTSNNIRPPVHQIDHYDYVSNMSTTTSIRPTETNFWNEMKGFKNVNHTNTDIRNVTDKADQQKDEMNDSNFNTTESVSNISSRPTKTNFENERQGWKHYVHQTKKEIRNDFTNEANQNIDRINNNSKVFATGDTLNNLQKNISNVLRWIPLTCTVIHGISYSFGVATVCSNVRSELFPMHVKGECSAITSVVTALTSFALSRSFPITRNYFGLCFNFAIYAASSFLIALLARFHLPETSGKTLQEIQDEMESGSKRS